MTAPHRANPPEALDSTSPRPRSRAFRAGTKSSSSAAARRSSRATCPRDITDELVAYRRTVERPLAVRQAASATLWTHRIQRVATINDRSRRAPRRRQLEPSAPGSRPPEDRRGARCAEMSCSRRWRPLASPSRLAFHALSPGHGTTLVARTSSARRRSAPGGRARTTVSVSTPQGCSSSPCNVPGHRGSFRIASSLVVVVPGSSSRPGRSPGLASIGSRPCRRSRPRAGAGPGHPHDHDFSGGHGRRGQLVERPAREPQRGGSITTRFIGPASPTLRRRDWRPRDRGASFQRLRVAPVVELHRARPNPLGMPHLAFGVAWRLCSRVFPPGVVLMRHPADDWEAARPATRPRRQAVPVASALS